MDNTILTVEQLQDLGIKDTSFFSEWEYDRPLGYFGNIYGVFCQLYADTKLESVRDVIHTLIVKYNLNIHANKDVTLASALLSKRIAIVECLLDLGCDLSICIITHANTLFKYGHDTIPTEMIELFMSRDMDIGWLYDLNISILHFSRYIQTYAHIKEEFIIKVIKYLAIRGKYPDDKSVQVMISGGYIDIFTTALGVHPDLDLQMCVMFALDSKSNEILEKLFSMGVRVNVEKLNDHLYKESGTDDIVNLLFDSGHTQTEIIEILKYI